MVDFSKLLKSADNEWASIAEDGIDAGDIKFYVDTGSYSLNALLSGSIYGGLAGNKRTVLAGESSVGKSFYALNIVKEFLSANPKGFVFYFESESAISKQMMVDRGIDVARVAVMPVVTVQDFRTQAVRILDGYHESGGKPETNPMMFVLDSLGNLSTSKEVEDISSGAETKDMTRAQLIKGAFRVLTLKLGQFSVPLISTNHVYANLTGYGPKQVLGGGTGATYAGDQIIMLSKSKDFDKEKNVQGVVIKATLLKSRLTIENKSVETYLSYTGGLKRYYGLVDIAVKAGIFKKVSTRIELPDGKTYFEKSINDTPEKFFTKDILDKIDEACKNEFLYGKTNNHVDEVEEDHAAI